MIDDRILGDLSEIDKESIRESEKESIRFRICDHTSVSVRYEYGSLENCSGDFQYDIKNCSRGNYAVCDICPESFQFDYLSE